MKRNRYVGLRAALLLAALLCMLAPRAAAQFNGSVRGKILDQEGKPWANLSVQLVTEQGRNPEAKTDAKGNYVFGIVKPGVYRVNVLLPNQGPHKGDQFQVEAGKEAIQDFNFKGILSKQTGYAEAAKKQEEEIKKVEGVKGHYGAGNAILEQMRQVKNELGRAPADQRDALKQKLTDLSNRAAGEFQAAQKGLGEKDSNLPKIWASLGSAYDLAGRDEEAINAYRQAIAAEGDSPDAAINYNSLGTVLARQGKVDDARVAYLKSTQIDPANAAMAWRNFGISLQNAGRMKESVEPLKKATELDPKSAQGWYLLAAALVSTSEYKQVGDKLEVKIPEGTVEAYQKALELDPNGRYGALAKQGLEGIQQNAPGIQTKVNTKKKKS
jgi:tetratricopeptide (TPR) repeat protein